MHGDESTRSSNNDNQAEARIPTRSTNCQISWVQSSIDSSGVGQTSKSGLPNQNICRPIQRIWIQLGNSTGENLTSWSVSAEQIQISVSSFNSLLVKFKWRIYRQRPQRGQNPVEHRGTFIVPSFIHSSVPPSGLSGFKSALSRLKSTHQVKIHHSGLKSVFSNLKISSNPLIRSSVPLWSKG